MKAVVVSEFGEPEQLRVAEIPDPDPGPGECLIGTEACDVLFLDTMLRRGSAPPEMTPQLPWIPGNGVAGRVVAVGDDVAEEHIGQRVGAHTGGHGAYAERAVAAVQDIIPIPDGVDALVAAALLHDVPTALKLVQVTAISAEDSVLVLGASGGLGIAVVQLVRSRARRVIAVARDPAKRRRIAALGPEAAALMNLRKPLRPMDVGGEEHLGPIFRTADEQLHRHISGRLVAAALIDHLVHHATMVTLKGRSYRLREGGTAAPISAARPAPREN